MSKNCQWDQQFRTVLIVPALLTPVLWAAAVRGEDAPASYNTDTVVVTGTRQGTQIGELAGNDTLVGQKQLQFTAPFQPAELLNQLPGVIVERDTGVEHFTAIRSPAFNGGEGAGSFLYLEDGVPMRAAGFAEINGLGEANMEQAGSVEVVRGPGSALYGSNAMHGMINIIPRDPSKNFESEVDVLGGYVTGGLVNGQERIMATTSGTVDNLGMRMSAQEHHEDGWRRDTRMDQQKWVGRSVWAGPKDTVTTTISGERLDEQSGTYVVGTSNYRNTDLVEANALPNAYRLSSAVRFMTRWQHDLSDSLQLSVTPYARFVSSDFLMHFLPSHAIQKNDHVSGGTQVALYKSLEGGHKVIVGTDMEYTQGSYSEYQSIPTVSTVYIQGWHYDLGASSVVVAPYVHTEWQVLDHTRVTVGARLESTTYDYTNNLSNGVYGLFKRIPNRSDGFLTFTPKFGVVQQWTPNLANYINLSVGSRAPQVTDLYELQKSQEVGRIKPETMQSMELGTRGNLGVVQFDTSAYWMVKDHYFYRDVSGLNVANGKTQHRGLEAAVKSPLGAGFDLGVAASYSLNEFMFNNPESVANLASAAVYKHGLMPNAPREQADVRLGYQLYDGRYEGARMELEWQLVGPYVTDQADTHSYGGYNLFNLRADVPLNEQVSVHAKLMNVADIRYADRATVTTASTGSASKDEYMPGQPRTILVGATVKF